MIKPFYTSSLLVGYSRDTQILKSWLLKGEWGSCNDPAAKRTSAKQPVIFIFFRALGTNVKLITTTLTQHPIVIEPKLTQINNRDMKPTPYCHE